MKKTLTKNYNCLLCSFTLLPVLAATAGYYILKEGVSIDAQSQTGITISSALIIFIIGPFLSLWTFFIVIQKNSDT